jgi:putative transposase
MTYACIARHRRVWTISPNLFDRECMAAKPDEVWVSDITYIATDECWQFLAVEMDLFSPQVVGCSSTTA